MRAAVIVFPGSNCDRDMAGALALTTGAPPAMVWHQDTVLPDGIDLVCLPGGFSYGDYLRCGAMASHARIMPAIRAFAARGGRVLGVCNGFQVLTECGLLPGALMRNRDLRFICRDTRLRVEDAGTPFTRAFAAAGEVITLPMAHHDGNYHAGADTLDALEDGGQVAFRYCAPDGEVSAEGNPNGSARNIAGIFNRGKTILGMMPHPERAMEDATCHGADGRRIFASLLAALA